MGGGEGGAEMSVKDEVLRMLEAHRGEPLSGESVAERLSVSRASVWKAVKALRDEGHKIGASTRRGYRMEPDSDILSEKRILDKILRTYHRQSFFQIPAQATP